MRLVLVGPPGAGKGTQAVRLAERLEVPHVSTGDLFRSNLTRETLLGREAKRYMDAGDLVPDSVTIEMVRERLTRGDAGEGVVLDGFPRTISQARALSDLMAGRGEDIDAVVEFRVTEEEVVQRLLSRGRTDDSEEVIRRRQEVYRQETAPLLRHYRDRLVTVDAVGSIPEITNRVSEALRSR